MFVLIVQNCAARLIMCRNKYDHITPILKELNWIPMQQRIIFKILLITYKALNDLAPIYISNLLNKYVPLTQLRSSSQYLIDVLSSNLKTYGDRAFSVCASYGTIYLMKSNVVLALLDSNESLRHIFLSTEFYLV